jgi:hypothetical protein
MWLRFVVFIMVNERTGRGGLSPNAGAWRQAPPHQPGSPALEVGGHGPRSLRLTRDPVSSWAASSHVRTARARSPPRRGPARHAVLASPPPPTPPPAGDPVPASPPAHSRAPRLGAIPPAGPSVGPGRRRRGVPARLDPHPLSLDQPGQDRLSPCLVPGHRYFHRQELRRVRPGDGCNASRASIKRCP